jgi:hypothetical protein
VYSPDGNRGGPNMTMGSLIFGEDFMESLHSECHWLPDRRSPTVLLIMCNITFVPPLSLLEGFTVILRSSFLVSQQSLPSCGGPPGKRHLAPCSYKYYVFGHYPSSCL